MINHKKYRIKSLCGNIMNMQQIPSKMKDIRRIFTAGTGNYFISLDFSRQEPACLASVSKDPDLIDTFRNGLDIYSKIASMAFGMPYEDCLEHNPDGTTNSEGKERRSVSKKITLSIMYSKGLKTLAEDLHSTPEKAQEIMDAVLNAYPVMDEWMQEVNEFAIKHGYVDNLFGRRRRWPELLKPPYEFVFPKGTDQKTIDYYSAIYLNKLKRAWFKDKEKIKAQIQAKGIKVIDWEAKQAEAKRQVVNFNVQGCLHGDSQILTKEHGIVSIKDVANQNLIIWDGKNFVKAGCIYSGKKQLVNIYLTDKRVIKCSPNHKFLFMDTKGNTRFKTADELSKMTGNSIMLVRGGQVADFNCITQKDYPKLTEVTAHNAHRYSIESITDMYELGYFLGWIKSDGSIIKGREVRLLVAENKESILPFLESIVSKYFTYKIRYFSKEHIQVQKKNPNIKESQSLISISSKTLGTQLLALNIKEQVPDIVLKSKDAMRGYIQACFDADGTASDNSPTFCFGKRHHYSSMAKKLQTMLAFFGISSRIHYCADRINVQVMKRDTELFVNSIGVRHPYKLQKLQETINYCHNSNYGKKYPEFAQTVRISKVEVTDEWVDMYDIVDSESHTFAVDGLITHNCAAVITMRAMRNIYSNQRLKELHCKLVMSIHDECCVIVPKQSIKEALPILKQCMISAGDGLAVPLSCDVDVSDRWYGEPVEVDKL